MVHGNFSIVLKSAIWLLFMNIFPPWCDILFVGCMNPSTLSSKETSKAEQNSNRMNWPNNVSATISRLVENYDNRLRPKFGTVALQIGMELIIASFDSISEVNMDYTITMYLNQYWHDDRLAFDLGNSAKQMTLTGEFASKIWVPDTFFANDKHSFLHDVTEENKMIRLSGNGSIFYGMRFTTTLACMMDLHYYPHDEQNCTVEVESYGYPLEDVQMYWKQGKASVHGVDKIKMPQFSLVDYDVIAHVIILSTGEYQRLSLSFRLARNVGFFVFQTYLPSILIVMLSWVSFWINHEATSARVALGITTVLTMTTISTGVRSSLPRISYIKAIDIYLVMCFAFVFTALLEYAAVNYTYWGARAKRKAKLAQQRSENRRAMLNNNSQRNNINSNRNHDVTPDPIRMSPILSLRYRSQTLSTETDPLQLDEENMLGTSSPPNSPALEPPFFRMTPAILRTSYPQRGFPIGLRQRTPGSNNSFAKSGGSRYPGGFGGRRAGMLGASVKQRVRSFKKRIPKVHDVNKIDKYSRLVFPSLFILFNFCYWCFYLL